MSTFNTPRLSRLLQKKSHFYFASSTLHLLIGCLHTFPISMMNAIPFGNRVPKAHECIARADFPNQSVRYNITITQLTKIKSDVPCCGLQQVLCQTMKTLFARQALKHTHTQKKRLSSIPNTPRLSKHRNSPLIFELKPSSCHRFNSITGTVPFHIQSLLSAAKIGFRINSASKG